MTPQRYKQVFEGGENLTDAEFSLGWHFCDEWDGLLVGPDCPEVSACSCEWVDPEIQRKMRAARDAMRERENQMRQDDDADPVTALSELLRDMKVKINFWVCDKGCNGRVTWKDNIATCEVCGRTSAEWRRQMEASKQIPLGQDVKSS